MEEAFLSKDRQQWDQVDCEQVTWLSSSAFMHVLKDLDS